MSESSSQLPTSGKLQVRPDGTGVLRLKALEAVPLRGRVSSEFGSLLDEEVEIWLEEVSDADGGSSMSRGGEGRPSLKLGNVGARTRSLPAAWCSPRAGAFEIGCDPTKAYRLKVRAPKHTEFERVVSASDRGVFSNVNVVLRSLHEIRSTVSPLASVAWLDTYKQQSRSDPNRMIGVVAVNRDSGVAPEYRSKRGTLSEDGRLLISDVPAGEWLLWLHGPIGPVQVAALSISSERVVEVPTIDLEHLRPGIVEGIVSCANPEIDVVAVSLLARGVRLSVPIGSDGSYRIQIPEGRYWLSTALNNSGDVRSLFEASAVEVAGGMAFQRNLVAKLERLKVQVVRSVSEEPLRNVAISVDEQRATGSFRSYRTDDDGCVELYPVPSGEFGVSILDRQSKGWTNIGHFRGSHFGRAWVVRVPR